MHRFGESWTGRQLRAISMNRLIGILALVLLLYLILFTSDTTARSVRNHQDLLKELTWYGLLTIGVGAVIISGGIDLSVGAVSCLASVALVKLLDRHYSFDVALALVLGGSALIGLFHGLLITQLRLQPFIVTLCGLFIWKGLAYWLTLPAPMAALRALLKVLSFGVLYGDEKLVDRGGARTVGLADHEDALHEWINLATGKPAADSTLGQIPVIGLVPYRVWLLALVAALMAFFLHATVYGRYVFAVGSNEQAARYAGISTNRYKLLPYVACSFLAGLVGVLLLLDNRTVQPSTGGNWFELYAITGAVLGGCSLRGGQGNVIGMILGAMVLPLLGALVLFTKIPQDLAFFVSGVFLLGGTVIDEWLKRRSEPRK